MKLQGRWRDESDIWEAVVKKCPGSHSFMQSYVDSLSKTQYWSKIRPALERYAKKVVKLEKLGEIYKSGKFVRNGNPPPPAKLLGKEGPKSNVGKEYAKEVSIRLGLEMSKVYCRACWIDEFHLESTGVLEYVEEHLKLIKSSGRAEDSSPLHPAWLREETELRNSITKAKDAGDVLFRKASYTAAVASYTSSIKLFSRGEKGKLLATLYCNRAAAWMGCRKYKEGSRDCTEALSIDGGYSRATLRRARCLGRIREWNAAKRDYVDWIHKNGSSPDVRKEDLEAVKVELEQIKKSQSQEKKEKERKNWFRHNFRDDENRSGRTNNDQRQHANYGGNSKKNDDRDSYFHNARRSTDGSSGGGGSGYPNGANGSTSWSSRGGHHHQRGNFHSNYSDSGPYRRKSAPQGSPGSDRAVCHYDVLSLSQSASGVEIKKAYHKLALKYHPDKNKEQSAADTFRRIRMAYECLSDADLKRRYDAELRVRNRRSYY